MAGVEVVHDALAQPSLGVAQTHDRSRADVAPENTASVGDGVSLSHESSGFTLGVARYRADLRVRHVLVEFATQALTA